MKTRGATATAAASPDVGARRRPRRRPRLKAAAVASSAGEAAAGLAFDERGDSAAAALNRFSRRRPFHVAARNAAHQRARNAHQFELEGHAVRVRRRDGLDP